MDYSCIMPTRGRIDLLKNCIHSFFQRATRPDLVEFWLALDIDDPTSAELDQFIIDTKYEVNYIKVKRTMYFHRDYHNRLIKLCKGKYIIGLNDECEIMEVNWDGIMKQEIEQFLVDKPDRIAYVYVNDTTHVGNNQFTNKGSCFPVFTKEAVSEAGCYIPDEIVMWGGDLFTFKIYAGLCENRILDIQNKITISHKSCHNNTRSADENTRRIEEISRLQQWNKVTEDIYVDRLNEAIRREKKTVVKPNNSGKFIVVDLKNAATVSTGSPFLNGAWFETIKMKQGTVRYRGVPFNLLNCESQNAIVLHGPLGSKSKYFPKHVSVECGKKISKIHLLGCTAGWGYQGDKVTTANNESTVSTKIIVNYKSGRIDSFDLINGTHIADFHNRNVYVSGSYIVDYSTESHPIRMLTIEVSNEEIDTINFVKPDGDKTAPIYLAITLEKP